jgi:hypothetical protein
MAPESPVNLPVRYKRPGCRSGTPNILFSTQASSLVPLRLTSVVHSFESNSTTFAVVQFALPLILSLPLFANSPKHQPAKRANNSKMRVSAIVFSGLAAVATATTSSWGTDPASAVYTSTSTSTSSSTSYYTTWSVWSSSSSTTKSPVSTSTSYDPTWSVWSSSSSTTKSPVSTSTSYDPTWSVWTSSSTTKSPVSTSTSYDPTWSAWTSSYTTPKSPVTTTACPAWTGGAAPPAYFTNLPASIKSALPSWTGAPPSDYCLYTSWMQSFSSCTAPAAAATTLATTGSYHPTWSSTSKNTNLLITGAAKATGAAYSSWTGTA